MKSSNFEIAARRFINELTSQLEEQDNECFFDIDYSNEVLSISFNKRTFIINKQSPMEEIWLASPMSGPYHFKMVEEQWLDKNGNNLLEILTNELSSLQSQKIILK